MMPNINDIAVNTETISNCESGKIQYNSFREAQININHGRKHRKYINGSRMNRRMGKKDIRPVRSYKCPICGFWHLTSQPNFNEK